MSARSGFFLREILDENRLSEVQTQDAKLLKTGKKVDFFKHSGDIKITIPLELSSAKVKKNDIPSALKRISCYRDPTVAS